MFVKIAIAICGAEESLQTNIEDLLNHVPMIDRCDQIESNDPESVVHEVSIIPLPANPFSSKRHLLILGQVSSSGLR